MPLQTVTNIHHCVSALCMVTGTCPVVVGGEGGAVVAVSGSAVSHAAAEDSNETGSGGDASRSGGSMTGRSSTLHVISSSAVGSISSSDKSSTPSISGSAGSSSTTGSSTTGSSSGACHTEEHAEYDAEEVVLWGSDHIKDSAGECCDACKASKGCNIW